MAEKAFSCAEFKKLLAAKRRDSHFTRHARQQSEKRTIPLAVFEEDLARNEPVLVLEEECETAGERKFDVYYRQAAGLFHRYVICLNNKIRLITLLRTSKDVQKKVALLK